MESYEIYYQYIIEQCDGEGVSNFPPITVLVNDNSLRRYTLNNSASTPVEADSFFQISLTAVNSVTRSVPSQLIMITTAEAGVFY